jgi:hypothetical protein
MSRKSNAQYKQFNNAKAITSTAKATVSPHSRINVMLTENRENGSAEPKPDSQASQRSPPIADMTFSGFVVAFRNL